MLSAGGNGARSVGFRLLCDGGRKAAPLFLFVGERWRFRREQSYVVNVGGSAAKRRNGGRGCQSPGV